MKKIILSLLHLDRPPTFRRNETGAAGAGERRSLLPALCFGFCVCGATMPGAESEVFVEAESFDQLGGWVIDQQSMAQMGSAYIMAHGMGIPVPDAETVCRIPAAGEWTVWARTRDWTAPWKRGKPAGTFQILINGRALAERLGTNGADWGWQQAGSLHLEAGDARIALHDLTGFNGRCDALYLTKNAGTRPESGKEKLAEFRRKVRNLVRQDDPVVYDLAVVGGGVAGICTAIAAIRTGSRVILIQDRPVLGGNNSSEIRVGLGGHAQTEPYPNLGRVVTEVAPILGGPGAYPAEAFEDARKANVFRRFTSNRYKLALGERVFAVEKAEDDPRKIAAVISRNIRTGAEVRYRARLFADCTGDAVVSRLMGASVMYGRESRATFNESLAPEKADNQVMGLSVIWYSKKAAQPTAFPVVDWGLEFHEQNASYIRSGDWEWETGQYRNQAEETEYIRDYALMVTYANWSFLKNDSSRKAEWARDTLSWVSPLGGKRDSYRVVGDHILTQNDIENHTAYPDATGSITWGVDLHFPDPKNARDFAEPFKSAAYHRGMGRPYPVPYRCLYAKDVRNLFLGGRDLSASHVAFSAVRVQRTLGTLGEVIGMAASICTKHNAYPRDVYEKYLGELKAMMEAGVPTMPAYHAYPADTVEKYHFKEAGFILVSPPDTKKLQNPEIKALIEAVKSSKNP